MSMAEFEKKIRSVTDTPFGYTLSMIGGKWRLVLLYWLVEAQPVRFNELQRKIGTITYKALSRELKEIWRRTAWSGARNILRSLPKWNTA